MIRNLVARFTLIMAAGAACGPSSQPAPLSGSDDAAVLAAARARAEELANSTRNYQPVRFVSELEQVRPPRPPAGPRPVDDPGTTPDSLLTESIPDPSVPESEAAPDSQADSALESSEVPRVPSIIPREAPMPEVVNTGGVRRDIDPGPDMGTVIGVVLRGGRVDPGHCPRHPRPPSQIPNRIPR